MYMAHIVIEAVGWIGAICVLGAYILLSAGQLNGDSIRFHLLNIVGAAGFVINTYAHGAIPSMVLNIIWAAVGAYALLKIARNNKTSPEREG